MDPREPKDVFNKISHADERMRIAQELIRIQAPLLCKAQASDIVFKLEGLRVSQDFILYCVCMGALPVDLPASAVVTFSIGNDKYFLTSPVKDLSGGGRVEIDFSVDLFHLQRRQSYRIRVPEIYKWRFEIAGHNGQPVKTAPIVLDLSSTGVRLIGDTKTTTFKVGDFIEGQLRMGERDPLTLKGRVQHLQVRPKEQQEYGVEFLELSPSEESRLFSITMELHRVLLAKLKS